MKAKRLVKRRAKVTRKPAAESSDEEEESRKRRQRRRRRVCYVIVPALTTSHSEDEEIIISSEWETNKSFTEAKTKSAATLCGAEAAVNPVPHLTPSQSEDEIAISGGINISSEWKTNKSFAEKKTKSAAEAVVPPAPTLTSSDSEDEVAISGGINISSEWKTYKSFAEKKTRSSDNEERPNLTTDSDEGGGPGVENMGAGNMKGGAGGTYEEVLTEAIKKSGQNLKLDHPTRGDGNCCSRSILQQCQRAPVKLFLQSRKVTFNTFMQLKHNVSRFIQENSNTQKVQNMRVNFEVSQLNIHFEGPGMRKRTWRQYWVDMETDAGGMYGIRWLECWADDIWLQAAAWYLDMSVVIIWAGDDTQGRIISTTDGHWTPLAEGEQRPQLYLGYIVRAHYQSLLPLVEDRIPQFVAQPAIDKTLQDTLRAVQEAQAAEEAKMKQGTQVNFSKITVHIEPVEILNIS